jgi:hypothetical protein
MSSVQWRLAAALMFLGALAGGAAALTLVKDGQPVSVIVVAKEASDSALKGADELQYFLNKMSGATVPIVTDDDANAANAEALILVGPSGLTKDLGVKGTTSVHAGYIIKTMGNALVIVGDDGGTQRTGTLFGVYGFLQGQLECQWIWPGVTGEYAPKQATIEVGELDIEDEPVVKRRHMRLVYRKGFEKAERLFDMSVTDKLGAEEQEWYTRMRMGRTVPNLSGHSFTVWWDKYGQTNPEIFALHPDGTREPKGRKDFVKMDVANPAFWDIQIEEFKKKHEANPEYHELACCDNDGSGGFCTCDLCKAWDLTTDNLPQKTLDTLDQELVDELKVGEDGIPNCLSARYAKWYNELARRVREVDPEGVVTGNGYTRFREIPLGVTLEPNIVIRYHGLCNAPTTPARRAYDRRDYLGWAAPGVKMAIRSNAPHYCENGMPFSVARENAEDIQFALDHGLYWLEFDSMLGHWASWGPSYYVLIRQAWEGNDMNVEDIINEWYSGFGPVERQVRSYYDFWEAQGRANWNKPGEMERFADTARDFGTGKRAGRLYLIVEHFPPEVTAEARKLLDDAFAAAEMRNAGDAVKEKLRNIEMSLTDCELTVQALKLSMAVQKGEAQEADLKPVLEKLIAYRRDIVDRNAVNVLWQTREEISSGNVLQWNLIPDYTK